MKFFLSAIYLFLLEMYYQHYVIFEALHVICKQLKIIYYPKLYRSTNVWILISFIKNGVFLIYMHTFTPFSILHTLLRDFWYLFPRLKKKRISKIRGHNWHSPGQTQPTGFLHRLWVLSLMALKAFWRRHCSQVPTSSCFPFSYTQAPSLMSST